MSAHVDDTELDDEDGTDTDVNDEADESELDVLGGDKEEDVVIGGEDGKLKFPTGRQRNSVPESWQLRSVGPMQQPPGFKRQLLPNPRHAGSDENEDDEEDKGNGKEEKDVEILVVAAVRNDPATSAVPA